MNVKVLGTGCSNCKKLYEVTKQAVSELDCKIELEYITDIEKIVSYGVMSTPALVIEEKVICQGKIISKDEVKKLIIDNSNCECECEKSDYSCGCC